MRRLFKQGFISPSSVWCDRNNHERFKTGWRDSEKLAAMKAAFLREQATKKASQAKKSRAA